MQKSTHTPEYRAILNELRAARAQAGLSQRELAARLKVIHTWVAKIETGERRVDVVEFCRFLDACDANPLTVLRGIKGLYSQQTPRRRKGVTPK